MEASSPRRSFQFRTASAPRGRPRYFVGQNWSRNTPLLEPRLFQRKTAGSQAAVAVPLAAKLLRCQTRGVPLAGEICTSWPEGHQSQ